MSESREIPEIATELVDISRDYLRQETIEPAKRLGKHAGKGVGGAAVLAFGLFLLAWGLYFGLKTWLPDGEWWVVLAQVLTAIAAIAIGGLIAWRMQSDDH